MINLTPFKQQQFADFSDHRNAQAMLKALEMFNRNPDESIRSSSAATITPPAT